jgi:autotransporter-associated beta strand protein
VNTNNATVTTGGGVNDGQGASTFTLSIGNLIKQGTGTFSLKSSTYGGYLTPGYNIYSPSVSVSAGKLRLLGATSLYDYADITIASGATFDLNAFSETISTIEGGGTITSATAATLTLLYNNPDPAKLITTFSGTISGAISLYKTSNQVDNHGYLYLTGSGSSYTGTTTVRIGGILVGHANALGAASGTTTVLNGATVGVFGGISIAEPFNIRGNGEGGIGVLRDSSGINTFTGAITLDSTAYITTLNGTSSDSLRLGAVNLGTYTLTIYNNVGIQAMGVIAGSGSIIKTGSSTVKLSAANTYTGFTRVIFT